MTDDPEFSKTRECKLDSHGNVKISIYELIEEMNGEDKEQMIEILGWQHPVYRQVIKNIRDTCAGKSYNEDMFRLRKAFFTMELEDYHIYQNEELRDIQYRMRETMEEILKENAEAHAENRLLQNSIHTIMDELKNRMGENVFSEFWRKHLDDIYPKTDADRPHIVARELSKKIDMKDFVNLWCENMRKRFLLEDKREE
jgi:hypothetical protein